MTDSMIHTIINGKVHDSEGESIGQMIDRAALIYEEEFIKSVTQHDINKKYMVSYDCQYVPTHEHNSLEAAKQEANRLIKKPDPPQTVRALTVESSNKSYRNKDSL